MVRLLQIPRVLLSTLRPTIRGLPVWRLATLRWRWWASISLLSAIRLLTPASIKGLLRCAVLGLLDGAVGCRWWDCAVGGFVVGSAAIGRLLSAVLWWRGGLAVALLCGSTVGRLL